MGGVSTSASTTTLKESRLAPTMSFGARCQQCSLRALEPYTTRQQDPTLLRRDSREFPPRQPPTTAPLTVLQTAAAASKMTCFNNSPFASIARFRCAIPNNILVVITI